MVNYMFVVFLLVYGFLSAVYIKHSRAKLVTLCRTILFKAIEINIYFKLNFIKKRLPD